MSTTENNSEINIKDELKKWKAIALAATLIQDENNDETTADSKLLVQYLMEKVYQQAKNDFETKMPEIVPYLKKSFLKTTKVLLETMPPLKVTNNSSHNNNASLSSKTTPQIPSTNKISTDKQHRFDNFIQSPYSVHIRIVNTSSSHTNDLSTSIGLGLGLNTTFTVYTIETEIYGPVPQSANTSNCKDSTTDNKSSNILISKFTIMRRHKEFQILYYQLRSAFPFCIIPTLPTIAHTPLSLHKPNTYDMIDDIEVRSQEVEKGGVEVDRNTSQLFQDDDNNSDNDIDDQHNKSTHSEGRSNNTNRHHIKDSYELKVHKRRRRLQLWLQYLSRCSFLVEYSTHFAEFLSGNSTLIPTSDTKAISSCTTGHVADMSLSHSQPQSPAMSLSSSASSFLTSLQTNINSLATILKSPSHILDLLSGKQRIIQAYLNSEHVYVNSRDSLALQLYSQLFHTYLNRMIPIRNRANSSSSVKGNEIHLPKTYRSFDDNDDDEDDEGDYSEAMSAAAISPNKTTTLTSRAYETAIGAISALGSTVLQTHTETGYDTGSLSNLQLPQVLSKTRSELLQQLLLRRMKLVDWDIAEVRSSSSAAVSTSKNWYLTVEALGQTYSDMAESGITGCLQLDQPVSENRHSRSGSIISTNDADSHTVSGDPSPNPYYSPGRKSTHRPYLPSESDNNHINNTDTTLNDFQTNSNSKYEKIVVQNESDYLLSQFLLKTTRTVSTYTFQLASLIKYSLFEPLQFLSNNQLSVAESCSVNTHLLIQHFSTQSLLNKTLDSVLVDQSSSAAATATATASATSTDMKIDSNIDSSIRTIPSNTPNNSDNDITNDIKHGYKGKALMLPHQVKIVGIFEQEWAEARKIRGTLLIHQLKSFTKSMAIQHKQLADEWTSLITEIHSTWPSTKTTPHSVSTTHTGTNTTAIESREVYNSIWQQMYQEISTPGLLQYNNPTRMPPSDRQYEEFSRCQQVITEAAGTTSAKTADNSINTRDDTLESILNTTTETVVKTETITTISEASFTLPIIAVETNEVLTTISAPAPVPVPVVHPQPEIVSKPPAQSVLRSSRRRQRVASNDSTTSDAPSVSSNIRSEHVYSYDDEDCNRAISVTKASSSFDVASSVAYYNEEEENQEGEHKTDEYKPDQTDSIIRPKEEDDDEELYNFVKDYTSSAFSSFQTPFLHRSDSNSTDQHNDAGQQDAYEDSILDRAFSAAMRSLEANNATDSQSQDNVHESETISKQQRRLQRQQAAQSSSQSSNYRRMKASSGAPVSTAVTPPAATLFTHQTTVQSATATATATTATATNNSKTTMSTPALSIIPPLYDDWQMPPRVHESTAGQLPVFDPPPLAPVINTGLATDQVPVNFSPFTDRKLTTVPATEFSDNGPVPRSASIDTSLPTGWEQVSTPEGAIYYYHVETRVSRWTRPDDSVAEAINSRLTEEKMKTDEVILRRLELREQEKEQNAQRAAQLDQSRAKVRFIVTQWRAPVSGQPKQLYELLNTVLNILPFLQSRLAVPNLTAQSELKQLKDAYLKLVRLIHPDKLSPDYDTEQRVLSEAVFIVISDALNSYRK